MINQSKMIIETCEKNNLDDPLCENIKTYEPIILFTKNTEYLGKIINNDISYIYCGNCKSNIKKLYLLSDLPKKYNIKVNMETKLFQVQLKMLHQVQL